MKYKILKEEVVFDDFFTIKKAEIEHDLFDSGTLQIERLCFERGDSVTILMYEKDTDSLLFTKQFRYPTIKEKDGWLIELPAGSVDEDEAFETAIRREVQEEIGYALNDLKCIHSFFATPGGVSERMFLFYAEVESSHKTYAGGGKKSEKEDIQLVKIQSDQIKDLLNQDFFRDAKTIIALQWFLLNKRK